MLTRGFLTIEINAPMLAAMTAGKFATFSPNMAKSVDEHTITFAAWLEHTLLEEITDEAGRYYRQYMNEYYKDELREIEKSDEEFFETLMFPACAKCKEVDSYTAYHGVCVRNRIHQCSSSLDAEEWVNSERYKEILENLNK